MSDFERPSIERIAELQRLIGQFAQVERSNALLDERRENDAEHSFGLAVTCWFLAARIAPDLDIEKVFKYALVHDLVEVYAGDVAAFSDPEVHRTKESREHEAFLRLMDEWPDFPEMTDTIEAYEAKADKESRFVYAVDKILPTIVINIGEKKDYWDRRQITEEMMRELIYPKLQQSSDVALYFDELFEWATHPDYFYKPDNSA